MEGFTFGGLPLLELRNFSSIARILKHLSPICDKQKSFPFVPLSSGIYE